MKNYSSIILMIFVGSYVQASGLSEPQVMSPVVGLNAPCKVDYVATKQDYTRAYNHYAIAVGQSQNIAKQSADNMVNSHLAARKQTCNGNARAATDNSGNTIFDGMGGIVLNLP
jgi:hypothetical protein